MWLSGASAANCELSSTNGAILAGADCLGRKGFSEENRLLEVSARATGRVAFVGLRQNHHARYQEFALFLFYRGS